MSDCNHQLPIIKRLFAFRGAKLRCQSCERLVFSSHLLSRALLGGVSAFYFLPFIALLFVVGRYWWMIAAVAIALILSVYVYEALFSKLETLPETLNLTD